MKQKFLLTLIALAFCSGLPAKDRVTQIRKRLLTRDHSTVIVASHRGDWRHFPENSLEAIDSAVEMGVDIVEIDVQRTKDSVLILMHDSKLDRTTTGSGKISELTYDSIARVRLKDAANAVTPYKVPTLEQALLHAKGKVMLNLDKASRYFDQVYALMEKTGTTKQIIMKGGSSADNVKKFYGKYLNDVIYMPVIDLDRPGAEQQIDQFIKDMNPVAFEFVFVKDTNSLPLKLSKKLKGKTLQWYNTMWNTLAGGYDDATSLRDPQKGYGYLLDTLGARIFQTDRPRFLLNYLRFRNLHD